MRAFSAFGFALIAASASAAPPVPAQLAARIDAHIDARLKAEKVTPAPRADDTEFLRRAYIDLTGRVPAPHDVHEFLADSDPNKRAKLVGDLLDGPRYATHFATVWRAALLPETAADAQARIFQPGFEAWLRLKFRANVPYDKLVRELLTAPISADPRAPDPVLRDPAKPNPLAFFAVKDAKAENLAAATARVFLGVQIECAQCHDHPFGRWERDQFWQTAAFFSGVERQGDNLFDPVSDERRREIMIPNTKRLLKATFLDGAEPKWTADALPRTVLAEWVTAKGNSYFARATANRIWGHLFGRGIVDPVDDFNEANKPSHPELLDELAQALADADFDLKFLLRAVCLTKAYQRTSAQTHPSQADPRHFSRAGVKGMTGEQLYDSLALATGYREPGGRSTARERFLTQFALRGPATEPETSITQALALMNGRFLNLVTSAAGSPTLVAACETPGMTPPERIEVLYVAALGRKPTVKELERMAKFVALGGTDRQAERLSDVFWVLLNSAEFRLNH
ncbi:Uncharacterized protein OS=Planctomyces maris DSM 8797 GN=PM8797T_28914 PE=4 SV=1: PSCyt2: PSD1: PSD1 [Gemmata massiliana]|uniref:Cytochrome c domain-containing protein n=1 Tax=Gemmata massiliana TaxID=1210884 RepID=A0A6P2DDL9_9BACT|nr:DUF1549 and DUF1553 domain-containing protein [Gemmata massiliana]VTR98485.1 Uncharacterized protein OS=Planctomyces maris DSM 8797 GN=PM8797T_28914 PE=4 SV=1: PSCyt2: PSD1: PSD1 [Gemmata massiliana]